MDDSINWYLHWAQGQIETWWAMAWPYLWSDAALRLHTLAALSILTAAATLCGYFSKRKVTNLEKVALNTSFRGPDPQHGDRIEQRKENLQKRAVKELEPFRSALKNLAIAGLMIPTATFLIITMNYNWFDPVGLPFLNLPDKIPLHTAADTTLAFFTLNQLVHGAMFDFFEVFNIDIVAITNNPHNYWFSGLVFLYRSLISAFVVALALGWVQLFFVKRSFRKAIKNEIKRIREKMEQLKQDARTGVKNSPATVDTGPS